MSVQQSMETLHPSLAPTSQLVEDIVDHFAVELDEEAADYTRHVAEFPLVATNLGLVSMGDTDVTFEKITRLSVRDGSVEGVRRTIYIASGSEIVFTAAIDESGGEVWGGYGDLGYSEDALGGQVLSDSDARSFVTKLAAEMWLHEAQLNTLELDDETIAIAVMRIASKLVRAPIDSDTAGDNVRHVYPVAIENAIWTGIRAEREWISDTALCYRLGLMDGSNEVIDMSVDTDAGDVVVSNYAGTEFEGDEAMKRVRIVLSALAMAVAMGDVPLTTKY